MVYSAFNPITDEAILSTSFKTIYEAVNTNIIYDYPCLHTWIIKAHAAESVNDVTFTDVIFSGTIRYEITPTEHNVIVLRQADNTAFYMPMRQYNTGFNCYSIR